MNQLLQNKNVLITGACGDIAQETIKSLKTSGAYVIGIDLKNKKSDDICDEFFVCDARSAGQLREVHQKCSLKITTIINAIGTGYSKKFKNTGTEDFENLFNTNVLTACNVVREFLTDLSAGSTIINFSSILAENPVPTLTAYATAKAALLGFTKSLAVELANKKICVNALKLGYCNTSNNQKYFESKYGINFIKRFIPTEQLVNKARVAGIVTMLCSSYFANMTGSVIKIDSGETIW